MYRLVAPKHRVQKTLVQPRTSLKKKWAEGEKKRKTDA